MMGLPPATCGQVSDVPMVSAKPLRHAGDAAQQYAQPHRALGEFERLEDLFAGDGREDPRVRVARTPQAFDSVYALLFAGKNRGYPHRIAHAASADSLRSACRSHRKPSLSSVIETIGRNRVKRLNSIRNQAKLAAVMLISVTLGT